VAYAAAAVAAAALSEALAGVFKLQFTTISPPLMAVSAIVAVVIGAFVIGAFTKNVGSSPPNDSSTVRPIL
jgi:hypothetical protein